MDLEFNKIIGLNIKRARSNANITQDEFAVQMDMTRSNVCNIEAGKTSISVEYLYKIAQIIGCDISAIMPVGYEFQFPDFKAKKLDFNNKRLREQLEATQRRQREILDQMKLNVRYDH